MKTIKDIVISTHEPSVNNVAWLQPQPNNTYKLFIYGKRNVSTSSTTASYELNIANLIYGNINEKKVGINKQTDLKGLLNIPSANGSCPQIVLDKSTLASTPIAGGLEFDGMNLYLTLSDGSRKKK